MNNFISVFVCKIIAKFEHVNSCSIIKIYNAINWSYSNGRNISLLLYKYREIFLLRKIYFYGE